VEKEKKKYPFIGIRIDEDTNARLDAEAEKMKVSKSAVIKQAIRHWFLLLRPSDSFERMIVYKNVFGFCLDHLEEKDLTKLSQLVMMNTFRNRPPNLVKKKVMNDYGKLTRQELIEVFSESLLESRGLGRNWYKQTSLEYDEADDAYYVELTHQISEHFSRFLYINIQDMLAAYTDLEMRYYDPFFGDTKISFYMRIIGVKQAAGSSPTKPQNEEIEPCRHRLRSVKEFPHGKGNKREKANWS